MKNNDNIKRHCIPIIYTQAIHLKDGIYAVSTKEQFQLRLTCQTSQGNSELQINPPLTFIKLQMTCSAHSEGITLLPYFTVQTTVKPKHEPFLALLQDSNFSEVKLWQPFIRTFPIFSNTILPETIGAVDGIPMGDLIDRLRTFLKLSLDTNWHLTLLVRILLGIILLGILIVTFKARRYIGLCLHRLCGWGKREQENPKTVVTTNVEATEPDEQTSAGTSTRGYEDWDAEIQKDAENRNRIKSIYSTLDLTTIKSVQKVDNKQNGQSWSPNGD